MFEHHSLLLSYIGQPNCRMPFMMTSSLCDYADRFAVHFIQETIKDLPQDDENLSNFAEVCDIFSDIEYTPQYCGQFSKLKQYADIHKDAISNNYVLIKRQDSSMIEEVTVWLCGIILEYDLPPILSETQYASSSPSSSSSSSLI